MEFDYKLAQIISDWLSICEKNQYKVRPPDATHSSLLKRLMDGDKPFLKAPPRAFSYPWVDLAEKGEAHIFELGIYDGNVCINQCADWIPHEGFTKEAGGRLTHTGTGDLYDVEKRDDGFYLKRVDGPIPKVEPYFTETPKNPKSLKGF